MTIQDGGVSSDDMTRRRMLAIKHVVVAALLAAAGLASFAALGFGQGGGPESRVTVVDGVELETVRTGRLPAAKAAGAGLAFASKRAKSKVGIKTNYLTGTDVPVNPGSGALIPLNCPGKSRAVSGGLENLFTALVVVSSSRTTTAAGAPPADWYQGVSNTNTGGNPLPFRPTLVCVKLKR